jgi:hypothetical protein
MARRTTRRSTARRSTTRRSTTRRAARRTARRSTPRRSARRTARRSTSRRSARRTARRSTPRRSAGRVNRKERVDAVSNILSAAYGIERRKSPVKKARKSKTKSDVDSFLAGIETSGSYGLKQVFKGDAKEKVARRGPIVKDPYKDDDTTGPLDPAAIKGQKVKEKKAKKTKRTGAKKTSPWLEHVKEFYAEKKKSDPNYKYSKALKDAKTTYKK